MGPKETFMSPKTLFSIWNNIIYLEQDLLSRTLFFTFNSILYLEQYSLPETVFSTWSSIVYLEQYSLPGTAFFTWNAALTSPWWAVSMVTASSRANFPRPINSSY